MEVGGSGVTRKKVMTSAARRAIGARMLAPNMMLRRKAELVHHVGLATPKEEEATRKAVANFYI